VSSNGKKKTAASEAFSLDDDEKDDEKDGAKDEPRFELSMVDHRRLGFVFEPPAVAADAAFARFVAHRARFCAVLLPSDWVEDADAPWRAGGVGVSEESRRVRRRADVRAAFLFLRARTRNDARRRRRRRRRGASV
jgi:hypothetical protein